MPKLDAATRIARLAADRTISPEPKEPKWGLERRRRIVLRMVNPDYRNERHEVITFLRKVMRCDLTAFFDHKATEHDMQNVERILKL
jgi:hypothetical protein